MYTQAHDVELIIVDMAAGGDIDLQVFSEIERAGTFMAFGCERYGEDTGNQSSSFYECKYAVGKNKPIILLRMIRYEQDFLHLQARVIFGMNKLSLTWITGQPMPPMLVGDILKAVGKLPDQLQSLPPTPPTTVVETTVTPTQPLDSASARARSADESESERRDDEVLQRLASLRSKVIDHNSNLVRVFDAVNILRRVVVDLDKHTIPLLFVIVPDPWIDESLKAALANPTDQQSVVGATTSVRQLMTRFQSIFKQGRVSLSAASVEIGFISLRLHLVCQKTLQPIGHGYAIKTPAKYVPQLLGLAHAGMVALKGLNSAAAVASIFFPGMPTIPEQWLKSVQAVIEDLDGTTMNEYACISEAAGGLHDGTHSEVQLSAFQVAEFDRFLQEHDPVTKPDGGKEYWKDLLTREVVTRQTVHHCVGDILWVSQEGYKQLLNEGALQPTVPNRGGPAVAPSEPEIAALSLTAQQEKELSKGSPVSASGPLQRNSPPTALSAALGPELAQAPDTAPGPLQQMGALRQQARASPAWVSNTTSDACMLCETPFSLIWR